MLGTIDTWRTITLSTVAIGQTCFVLLYSTFPWYKTFLGRALFYKAATLAAITDAFFITRLFGMGHIDALFVTLYGLLGLGVWWQFCAFLLIRYHGKQDPDRNYGPCDPDDDLSDSDGAPHLHVHLHDERDTDHQQGVPS